ncbi:hypothetical protein DFO70_1119 [Cytobacillus firmus]|uniref:Uncharacterized protein n=2 Tax=Cytobacillus TaxID=2675230 RepID=A0A366JPQ6_CYTFI|nr:MULTISPECIES: hypothetical protein [Cytobacillus]RBP89362.1 hypothetical protein DFO70_1119 [Cytobacillus firmus]TDX47411.1 hypothetical protein DFO72_101508 [Cytobacillus oceanisediminis]
MGVSKELLKYVADGDEHLKLSNVKHSTSLREIVTVEDMIENPIIGGDET